MSLIADEIDLTELLEFHNEGLQGWTFDEHIRRDGYSLIFSSLIEDTYYNYLCAGPETSLEACLAEEHEFHERGRELAVYVPYAGTLGDELSAAGFSEAAKDVWLVNSLPTIKEVEMPDGMETVVVDGSNQTDVEQFLDVFAAAFSGAETDDPYGAVDRTYREAMERAIYSGNEREYPSLATLARLDGQPVAMSHVLLCGEWVGGYGLGTVPSARRTGLSDVLRDVVLADVLNRGATKFFMQTEYGSKNHTIFLGWGFQTLRSATYYVRAV